MKWKCGAWKRKEEGVEEEREELKGKIEEKEKIKEGGRKRGGGENVRDREKDGVVSTLKIDADLRGPFDRYT